MEREKTKPLKSYQDMLEKSVKVELSENLRAYTRGMSVYKELEGLCNEYGPFIVFFALRCAVLDLDDAKNNNNLDPVLEEEIKNLFEKARD